MKIVGKSCLVMLGLLLLLVGIYAAWGMLSGSAVEARIAALRDAGAPTTWADLKVEMPPEEDNGAALLDEAIELLSALPQQGGPRDFLTLQEWQRWTVDDLDAARVSLDQLVEPIALVEEALSRPTIVYQVADDPLQEPGRPPFLGMREVVRLWLARARYHRLSGEAGLATRELVQALRLGESIGRTSILGLMVRVSVATLTLEEIQDALTTVPADIVAMQAALDEPLAAVGDQQLLSRAFEQERVFGLEVNRLIESGEQIDGVTTVVPGWAATPFLLINLESYLEAMDEMVEISALSYVSGQRRATELNERLEELGILHVLTKLTLPGLAMTFEAMARHQARVRLARISLAASAMREETGAWPGELEELAPRVGEDCLLDPCNDRPFALDHTSAGIRLRSAWSAPTQAPGQADDATAAGMIWDLRDRTEPESPR